MFYVVTTIADNGIDEWTDFVTENAEEAVAKAKDVEHHNDKHHKTEIRIFEKNPEADDFTDADYNYDALTY